MREISRNFKDEQSKLHFLKSKIKSITFEEDLKLEISKIITFDNPYVHNLKSLSKGSFCIT